MLYMVNKSPLMTRNLDTCLAIAPAGDPILLYEDGVYGALPGGTLAGTVQQALERHPIYALDADLESRGIGQVLDGIRIIDYPSFVGLVEKYDVIPWL
jgi:tRNA 2-thiouridine synthesizing protein B